MNWPFPVGFICLRPTVRFLPVRFPSFLALPQFVSYALQLQRERHSGLQVHVPIASTNDHSKQSSSFHGCAELPADASLLLPESARPNLTMSRGCQQERN